MLERKKPYKAKYKRTTRGKCETMKKKSALYPGAQAVEREKDKARLMPFSNDYSASDPDFIGGKPNYSKFDALHIPPEKVLAYLNID